MLTLAITLTLTLTLSAAHLERADRLAILLDDRAQLVDLGRALQLLLDQLHLQEEVRQAEQAPRLAASVARAHTYAYVCARLTHCIQA